VLRRISLNVHIYGGLLCFSYLIILGISVLNFNHPFAFTKPQDNATTWTPAMAIPALAKADGTTPADAMQRQNNAAIVRAGGSFRLDGQGAAFAIDAVEFPADGDVVQSEIFL
jgi:hypothetical protein